MQVNINPYVNLNIKTYVNGSDYPNGGTNETVAGVKFTLANYPGGGTGVIATPSQSNPSSFDISVNVADPTNVYTLINSTWGTYGDKAGAVEFKATGGLDYTVNLVEGQNIRDYNNDGFNNTIGQGALGGTYLGTASFGGGQVRFDEQGFTLPTSFQSATLTDIILHGYGDDPIGAPLLAAATVTTDMPTLTALRATTSSAAIGQSVTFTATVADLFPAGATPNGGTVTFSDQGGAIGSAALVNGVAEFTTSSLAAGTNTITASYGGTAAFAASSTGTIVTAVGNGKEGYKGNNGPAPDAELNNPIGMGFDSAGDMFITDYGNNVVREVVKATGDIITVAGDGEEGYTTSGLATDAALDGPDGVVVDSAGDLFISELDNVVQEVVKSTGDIMTVAGNTKAGYSGDGELATSAKLNEPHGLTIDASGDLFIADSDNDVIREVVKATGDIMTVAGNHTFGYNGDNIPATDAELAYPFDVTLDSAGDMFIADTSNNRIREVVKATGNIITVAGNGTEGYGGDNAPATDAELDLPFDVTLDSVGDLFIVDTYNNRIREVVKATGDIITVAGDGSVGYTGDNGPAIDATMNNACRAAVDGAGDLFFSDSYNNVVREVTPAVTVTIGPSTALPTLTAISASAAAVVPGQPVTFTATVSDLSSGGAIPNGGTVTFSDQNGAIDSETLVDGVAEFTTSSLAAGVTYTVTASYGGTAGLRPERHGHDRDRRRQRHRRLRGRQRARDRRRVGRPPLHGLRLGGRHVHRRHGKQRRPRGGQVNRRHHHLRRKRHRRLQRRPRTGGRRRAEQPL